MNRKECEALIPIGVQLYHTILDPETDPEIHVLDGNESESEIRGYFERTGTPYYHEKVVLGLALRNDETDIALISADGVQTPFQFLQVLWHEMGHCTYRHYNPKILSGDQLSVVCEQKMLSGVVEKFWDEVIAQSASNKVIQNLSEDLMHSLCPDFLEQSARERNLLKFFLHKGIQGQNAASQVDDPLLKLVGVPFDPYALAIYSAESATNPLMIIPGCSASACDDPESPGFKNALNDLIGIVGKQYAQDNFFNLSQDLFSDTFEAFISIAAALGAKEETLALMNCSLKDLAKIFSK